MATTFVGTQSANFPYSAVVYLEVTYASGDVYTGSGVMVGPNDVLTAAHMVYSDPDGLAVSVQIYAGYNNGVAPYGHTEAARINYFDYDLDGNDLLSRIESQDDIAILSLSIPLGQQTGWMEMTANYSDGTYNLTGYPGVYSGAGGARMTNDAGYVTEDPYNWVFNYTSIESNPGNSGGPLWFQGASGPQVVGVASTGGWAADVTRHFDQLQAWISANDDLILADTPPAYVIELGRLYEAGLARAFDAPGLNYWIDSYEGGRPLVQIASIFLDSPEFTNRFGDDDAMSTSQFLTVMYQNALDRAPDASGLAYWTGQMNAGMSREMVLINFAGSAENVGQSAYLQNLHEVSLGYWNI